MIRKVEDMEEDKQAPEVRPQSQPATVTLEHLAEPQRAELPRPSQPVSILIPSEAWMDRDDPPHHPSY